MINFYAYVYVGRIGYERKLDKFFRILLKSFVIINKRSTVLQLVFCSTKELLIIKVGVSVVVKRYKETKEVDTHWSRRARAAG